MAIGEADAVPGALLSRATAGDLMNAHPHLHAMVSCGAWSEGERRETFLPWPSHLTGARLDALFQRKVLTLMVRRERLAPETAQRLMGWNPTGFSVWVGDPIVDRPVLDLLNIDDDTLLQVDTDGKRLIITPVEQPAEERKRRIPNASAIVNKKYGRAFKKLSEGPK